MDELTQALVAIRTECSKHKECDKCELGQGTLCLIREKKPKFWGGFIERRENGAKKSLGISTPKDRWQR